MCVTLLVNDLLKVPKKNLLLCYLPTQLEDITNWRRGHFFFFAKIIEDGINQCSISNNIFALFRGACYTTSYMGEDVPELHASH